MTEHDIAEALKAIEDNKRDNEVAHSLEKQLWRDVLQAVANFEYANEAEAAIAAEHALKSRDIKFERWFA